MGVKKLESNHDRVEIEVVLKKTPQFVDNFLLLFLLFLHISICCTASFDESSSANIDFAIR